MKNKNLAAVLALLLGGWLAADAWYLQKRKEAVIINLFVIGALVFSAQIGDPIWGQSAFWISQISAIVRGIRLFAMEYAVFDEHFNGGKASNVVPVAMQIPPSSLSQELSNLAALYKSGSLSDQEYQKAKERLLTSGTKAA